MTEIFFTQVGTYSVNFWKNPSKSEKLQTLHSVFIPFPFMGLGVFPISMHKVLDFSFL